ncbi:hypothetical protein [Streptomyces sp. NPDC054975]
MVRQETAEPVLGGRLVGGYGEGELIRAGEGGGRAQLYAGVLSANLADLLPPGSVRVERWRTPAERLAGCPGTVAALDLVLGEQRLSLRLARGQVAGEICHEVRGIVLSRRPVGLDQWTEAMARALSDAAASRARAREAIERFLA